ncbi:carbohydrate kinase family protein [Martelella alba]|nr:PfkB family carbohydrate kinase [Martelella alba]
MTKGAVYCLGPLVLDRILTVDDLPGHDEKAFIKEKDERAGGPPLNCAFALSRFGEDARLVSTIGDDGDGTKLMQWLAENDLSTEAVEVEADASTASAMIIVDHTGEKAILIDPMRIEALEAIGTKVELQPGDTVIANLFHPEAVAAIFARAEALGLSRMIDLELPEIERWGWDALERVLPRTDIAVTNRQMLEAWMKRNSVRADLQDAAITLAKTLVEKGAGRAIVTLGAEGLIAFADGAVQTVTALKVTPKNTTGAGDVFLAGLATALRRGSAFERALRQATACSAHFLETGKCEYDKAAERLRDRENAVS